MQSGIFFDHKLSLMSILSPVKTSAIIRGYCTQNPMSRKKKIELRRKALVYQEYKPEAILCHKMTHKTVDSLLWPGICWRVQKDHGGSVHSQQQSGRFSSVWTSNGGENRRHADRQDGLPHRPVHGHPLRPVVLRHRARRQDSKTAICLLDSLNRILPETDLRHNLQSRKRSLETSPDLQSRWEDSIPRRFSERQGGSGVGGGYSGGGNRSDRDPHRHHSYQSNRDDSHSSYRSNRDSSAFSTYLGDNRTSRDQTPRRFGGRGGSRRLDYWEVVGCGAARRAMQGSQNSFSYAEKVGIDFLTMCPCRVFRL